MLDFITASPCSYFAVANAARRLDEAGFTRLLESQPWQLAPGGRYYTTRGGSSLIAFTILLFIAVRLDASTRQFSLNNKF